MKSFPRFACVLLAPLVLTEYGAAQLIKINPPGEREFIVDLATILDPADEQKIRGICDKLLTDTAAPIIVVTIESMNKYGGAGLRIETFATLLFNQWGIGHAKIGKQVLNHGILLLVSIGDRKARIELGAGWGHEKDDVCRRIMDDQIVKRFKGGDFRGGILAGVEALEKMARGFKIPKPRRPWWHYALVAVGILTIVSLVRSGKSGWGWGALAAVFGLVFAIITILAWLAQATGNGGGGGGGFSGGSFGGGSSGGGGASGSW